MINITNIERFSTHDGPGIRTTVFLKGCPLHCPWCANPETQSLIPELLYTESRCSHCRTCAKECPSGAITFNEDGQFCYRQELCRFCQICVAGCLCDALEFQGKAMEVDEIMAEVMKDKDYYDNSRGGGITVSGGEPFVQVEGLVAILRASRAWGLNTAVETTGSYPLVTLQKAESYIDHFLYDFKHLDDERLRTVTGGNGAYVKSNLKYLLNQDADKVNVRMPIIPGFNFEPELIKSTLRYLKDLGTRKVNLLPYHILGRAKYEKMGKKYQLDAGMLYEEDLEEFHQYALSLGLESRIGA